MPEIIHPSHWFCKCGYMGDPTRYAHSCESYLRSLKIDELLDEKDRLLSDIENDLITGYLTDEDRTLARERVKEIQHELRTLNHKD